MATGTWIEHLQQLADALGPAVELSLGKSLERCTTLRVGGPAEALVDVASTEALAALLELKRREDFAFAMLGKGANILFPDTGVDGVVCRLVGEFRQFSAEGTVVRSGAGVVLAQLAKRCAQQGLVGLEPLGGFPATVGGGVTMNAGCSGTEIKDLLIDVDVLLPENDGPTPVRYEPRSLAVDDLAAGYRTTNLKGGAAVVTSARFQLSEGDREVALARLDELNRKRWASLPSGKPNAGSIFRNPPGDFAGRLLDEAGVKGLRIGDASFSDKHANVIVNLGAARATDVVAIMRSARDRVQSRFGVTLIPELILWGELQDLFAEGGA